MTWIRTLTLAIACAAVLGGNLKGAMISLDTAGADPDITSPMFSFTMDTNGAYVGTFRNISNPPQNFITLSLVATFTQAFYNSPNGPANRGYLCNPDSVFIYCSVITSAASPLRVEFYFYGTDATHPGLPYLESLNLRASDFAPNQVISANAITVAASTVPEPATLSFVSGAFTLLGFVVFRNQRLKRRVASHCT